MMLVRMVELLIGDPPQLHYLKYICDHLLLPDLNEVKIVRGSDTSTTLSDSKPHPLPHPLTYPPTPAASTTNKSASSVGGTFESFTASESLEHGSDHDPEVPVFDVQSQDQTPPTLTVHMTSLLL